MRGFKFGVLLALVFVVSFASFTSFVVTAKQEHDPSYPQTHTWVLGVYDRFSNSPEYKNRIQVIDTAGVCLYLLQADAPSWEAVKAQLVAVPKTQLPKGAGCQ